MEGLTKTLDSLGAAIELIGSILGLVAGFFVWLGIPGTSLLLITAFGLWLVNSVSPLPRIVNFAVIAAATAGFALYMDVEPAAIGRYLVVVGAPILAINLPVWMWRIVRGTKRPETDPALARLEALAEKMAGDIDDLRKRVEPKIEPPSRNFIIRRLG